MLTLERQHDGGDPSRNTTRSGEVESSDTLRRDRQENGRQAKWGDAFEAWLKQKPLERNLDPAYLMPVPHIPVSLDAGSQIRFRRSARYGIYRLAVVVGDVVMPPSDTQAVA